MPTLAGERVILRQGTASDLPDLVSVFDHPEVSRWWPDEDEATLSEKIEQRDDVEVWVIEVEGRAVGLIQASEQTDPQYRHAGIDLAVHPDLHGRGLGPEVISVLVGFLSTGRGHHRVVIDPNAANTRAVRAYTKVGFRPVGVMQRYEWDAHLGRWTDGVLMEWVSAEL
ncbi:MAG: GNAT family protein [Acidimicrobiia bacterium]